MNQKRKRYAGIMRKSSLSVSHLSLLHLSLSHKTLISSPSEFPDSSFLPSLNSSYTDTVLALTNSSSTLYDAHTTPKVSIFAASILPFGSLFDSFEVGDSRHRFSLSVVYEGSNLCCFWWIFINPLHIELLLAEKVCLSWK